MKSPLLVAETSSRAGRKALERLLGRASLVLDGKILAKAAEIVDAVRRGGDKRLVALARRFDGSTAKSAAALRLAVPPEEETRPLLPPGFAEALERAVAAVSRFHAPQVGGGYRLAEEGVELIERVEPLGRVGVYVPGGRASYPSTVVMTVVPAQLAGVAEIAVATPPTAFEANPALRYTLARLGIHEVWGMGGAHAVAAFAYGTETIARVDKIVGPGNAWVTAAKRAVAGDVAIDGLAGPSEVVIAAARGADPALVAADLLAQAEHDPQAAAVLLTLDRALAKKTAAEVARQLPALATRETARESLERYGAALVTRDWEEVLGWIEEIAPEHLQLVGEEAEALADRVRRAGAIFLGAATPEVFGDYLAGPSHVLPTCGTARFASALGVADFVRRSHLVRFSPQAAVSRAAAAAVLAEAEGLPAHAASARRRLG